MGNRGQCVGEKALSVCVFTQSNRVRQPTLYSNVGSGYKVGSAK